MSVTTQQTGAVIDSGLSDWQIVQQDDGGHGTVELLGRWFHTEPGAVEVRVVREDTSAPVGARLDWQKASTQRDGTWRALLRGIPAGGLYRVETRYHPRGLKDGEWSFRGDMRHYIGVGDLWVIAGQSNSAGYGMGPLHDPPELGVHVLRNSEQWALASHPLNDSTDTKHVINREVANPGHSPYIHLGRLLQQELHHPIGFIQTAFGGSSLAEWNPAEGQAPLYENMLHCVDLAGGCVKGIFWYQGETDACMEEATETYVRRFKRAVAAWRKALGDPRLPVVTVQLNRRISDPNDAIGDRRRAIVREAQRQAARQIPNVSVVPALGLPTSDRIHNSPAANFVLAQRLADATLGAVHGRALAWRAPDVEEARRLRGDKVVEVRFANVASRLGCNDPRANSFVVETAEGFAAIDSIRYPGGDTIELMLSQKLTGKAMVHGGYGLNPPLLPMDMERQMPMLAFYGVPVA